MRIAIVAAAGVPAHAHSLEERPLGGTETAVICLAQELHQLGHRVTVVTPLETPPLSVPLYLPLRAIHDLGEHEVLISVRDWNPLLLPLPAKKRLLWTGDSYDQPSSVGFGDKRIAARIDRLLAVSNWHADGICAKSGFPRERTWVLRNGVQLALFSGSEPRARKRLIYSSTPYRGLAFLPAVVTDLRRRHPDLELHVFSGMQVYQGSGFDPRIAQSFEPLFALLRATPGCVVHGNVKQDQLAREFMRSSILAYPNSFEETSCITAMEAQAAGCPIVSSALGALPETVKEAGILITGAPTSPEYLARFTEALDKLLSDDVLWNDYSQRALAQAREHDWRIIAQQFSQFLAGICAQAKRQS